MIWIYGRPFERLLEGGPGDDSLTGGAGADLFLGGPGFDTLVGGPGLDIVDYSGSPRGVGVLLRLTYHASDEGSHAWGDRYQGIEGAIGSRFRDSLLRTDPAAASPGASSSAWTATTTSTAPGGRIPCLAGAATTGWKAATATTVSTQAAARTRSSGMAAMISSMREGGRTATICSAAKRSMRTGSPRSA